MAVSIHYDESGLSTAASSALALAASPRMAFLAAVTTVEE